MSRGSPCLLIVDPDEQFRAALVAEAHSAGLQTICCAHWWEAQPVLEGPGRIDGMIVELELPQGTPNGLSVGLMAKNRRGKGLPVVFTSARPDLLGEVREGTGPLLSKAVGAQLLVLSVVSAIEAEGGGSIKPIPQLRSSPRLSLDPVAKYQLDEATCFRGVNDGALVLWRKSRTELLGRRLLDVFPQMEGQPKFRAHLEVLERRSAYRGRVRSVILQDQIDIRIARDRIGLRVSFALAA